MGNTPEKEASKAKTSGEKPDFTNSKSLGNVDAKSLASTPSKRPITDEKESEVKRLKVEANSEKEKGGNEKSSKDSESENNNIATKENEITEDPEKNGKEAGNKDLGKETSEEITGEDSDKDSEKKESSEAKKPFVFGQNSKFGSSAFASIKNKPSVFSSNPSTPAKSTGFVFGSNSKYANAFQNSIKKPSIFDKKESEDKDKEPLKESEKQPSKTLYQAVKLQKKEVISGEENETVIFDTKAKLYVLNLKNINEGWKERGVGILHVNQNGKSHRIVMRTLTVMKVILNAKISQKFEVFKGMESSLHTEKFVRFNAFEMVDGENILMQYAVRVSSSELAEELYNVLKKASDQE